VGSLLTVLLQIFCRFRQWKSLKIGQYFDEVIRRTKVCQIFGPPGIHEEVTSMLKLLEVCAVLTESELKYGYSQTVHFECCNFTHNQSDEKSKTADGIGPTNANYTNTKDKENALLLC